MSELDLSKATEAGARAMFDLRGAVSWDKLPAATRRIWARDAQYILDATLPYILGALHARAVEEMGVAEPFSVEMDDIDAVVRWLSARAEAARD